MAHSTTSSKSRKNHDADAPAEVIETLKTSVEDATDAVQEKATDLLDKVRDQIIESPIQSVAMALSIGYVARIMFRGPFATLLAIGAGGYLGARMAK